MWAFVQLSQQPSSTCQNNTWGRQESLPLPVSQIFNNHQFFWILSFLKWFFIWLFISSNSVHVVLFRHCSEGKRTFSSRLILEKHIRVRHGIRARQTTDRPVSLNTLTLYSLLYLIIHIFILISSLRALQTPESVHFQVMGRAVHLSLTMRAELQLQGAAPIQMTSRERTPRVQWRELELLKTDRSIKRKTTARSVAHPAASPPRIGMSFSATFPSTVMRRTRLSSACNAEPASPRPALSADTNSSRTACAKVSMMVVVETHHLAHLHRTDRRPHLKRARRGTEGWAAGCAAGASTKPRTLTHTSARMAWPSSRHTGPTSPSRTSKMGKSKERKSHCKTGHCFEPANKTSLKIMHIIWKI